MAPRRVLALLAPIVVLAWAAGVLLPRTATAGCGCDHPPAGWAPVMPPFGSPGKPIRVNAPSGKEFLPGAPYLVRIGGKDVLAVALKTSHVEAKVPVEAAPGPAEIEVIGTDWSHKYAKSEFTVLPPAPLVPEQNGLFAVWNFQASVAEDGTLLVPFNLSAVADATQFLVVVKGLPLSFDQDDVVFYNSDGIDLTLFTLSVSDPTQRQWGSYYGWDVEQDQGFKRRVFQNKVMSWLGSSYSNQLTYWRHEFRTYKAAHEPGGTHEVDENGYHKGDGTLHIDHDHLVLAISGRLRDPFKSSEYWPRPSPGRKTVDVMLLTAQSEQPIEPQQMMSKLTFSMGSNAYVRLAIEKPDVYRTDD